MPLKAFEIVEKLASVLACPSINGYQESLFLISVFAEIIES